MENIFSQPCSIIYIALLSFFMTTSSLSEKEHLLGIHGALVHKIKTEQAEAPIKKCHYFPGHAREDFSDGRWAKELPHHSLHDVILYSPCLTTYNLGNTLGDYFDQISCGIAAGVCLVTGKKIWDFPSLPTEYKGNKFLNRDRSEVQRLEKYEKYHFDFFDALPSIFGPVGRNESIYSYDGHYFGFDRSIFRHGDRSSAVKAVNTICKCEKYCWTDPNATWTKQHILIREIMQIGLRAHFKANESRIDHGTSLRHGDFSSLPRGHYLPVVPTVAIHYRCGDTVPSKIYGFLPFHAILPLIPKDASSIYVLSDPIGRPHIMKTFSTFSMKCDDILRSLFNFLVSAYPKAIVIVKRGGDPLLDYVRLAYANITICSTSTFCLWPAIASSGQAYFPVTGLIGGWTPEKNFTPFLGSHFHWIYHPPVITEFTITSSLEHVLGVLNGSLSRSVLH